MCSQSAYPRYRWALTENVEVVASSFASHTGHLQPGYNLGNLASFVTCTFLGVGKLFENNLAWKILSFVFCFGPGRDAFFQHPSKAHNLMCWFALALLILCSMFASSKACIIYPCVFLSTISLSSLLDKKALGSEWKHSPSISVELAPLILPCSARWSACSFIMLLVSWAPVCDFTFVSVTDPPRAWMFCISMPMALTEQNNLRVCGTFFGRVPRSA